MSVDRERPLAEVVASASTVAELVTAVENAGGIRKTSGSAQDLNEIRQWLILREDETLDTLKRMEKIVPSYFAQITNADGFRKRLMILWYKELAAKKTELGG